MVNALHKMVGLERMSDYRVVGLQRFYCIDCWRFHCAYLCKYQDSAHVAKGGLVTHEGNYNLVLYTTIPFPWTPLIGGLHKVISSIFDMWPYAYLPITMQKQVKT